MSASASERSPRFYARLAGTIYLVAMALSMFGAFELGLPQGLQERLSRVGGRGFGGAFLMGLVAGLIAAPCTGPPLAGLLAYISTTRDAAFGFGISAGYKMLDLGVVQLSPMLGFRSLPTQIGSNQSLGGTTLDLGIRLSVGI